MRKEKNKQRIVYRIKKEFEENVREEVDNDDEEKKKREIIMKMK